jgi:hypothetical protein
MAREVDPAWRAPSWNQRDSDPDVGADATALVQITTDILNRNVAPPPVMPLAVFGPGWGEWTQQAAVAANAPVDYVAPSLLAIAGSLIGNARWGQAWNGWSEPSVLWCGLVGEPSASKTPAANAVLKLLRLVEADMAEGFDETHADALRLAVVLELLHWAWSGERQEPTEISGNAMRRAVKLMREYFLPMASRVLGDAAITQQERDGRTLAKWIAAERPRPDQSSRIVAW